MNNMYRETFGRVDGKVVIDEIATYEKEDNYGDRIIVAVVKFSNEKFGYGIQYLTDDPDGDVEYPKFYIKETGKTEEAAIEDAEEYFNECCRS